MDIEKPKTIFTQKHQLRCLNHILERSDIGVVAKSILINKQINVHFDEDFVYEFLESMNQDEMNQILFYMEDPNELENTIPSPKSASNWSEAEMKYYGIDIVKGDFIQMFGYLSPLILSENIEGFLNKHSDLFLKTYPTEKLKPNFDDFSEFANYLDSYFNQMKEESRVDNLLRCFIHSILGDAFIVETQVSFPLIVNNSNECEAIIDVAASYVKIDVPNQIITVEDKTISNMTDNLEAQMIARGIAVSQQKNWKEERPLYMITSAGLVLKLYKCCFSKKFLKNVEKGYDCGFKTEVLQLITDLDVDLGKETGRRIAAFILSRISYECKKKSKLG